MKIRIEGATPELDAAVDRLRREFLIQSVSKPYKNRTNDLFRVYVEAELPDCTPDRFKAIAWILGIRNRALNDGERKWISHWIDMGVDDTAIQLAWERTCQRTSRPSMPYTNAILKAWADAGLLTRVAVENAELLRRKAEPPESFPDPELEEDKEDLIAYEKAMEEYRKNPVTFTHEEVVRELGLASLVELYAYVEEAEPDEKIRKIVRNCIADQSFEGMICDKEDVDAMLRIARGETSAEVEVARIKAKYRKP